MSGGLPHSRQSGYFSSVVVNLIGSESKPDYPTLSIQEKVRRGQLILTVEKGLSNFLAVGAALLELRSSRLYRDTHESFESFCRDVFGLARSSCDGLIRSTQTVELLVASGVKLPDGLSEAVVRPLASLPVALQPEAWALVEAASSKAGPTSTVSQKVVRQIKNALETPENGAGNRRRRREHSPRELAFIAPVRRLSAYKGFDADLATSHVETLGSALSAFTAFRIMADRCLSCCRVLADKYPELTDA